MLYCVYMEGDKKMAVINLRLPTDLRDEFKVVCAKERTTITAALNALIANCVEKQALPSEEAPKTRKR